MMVAASPFDKGFILGIDLKYHARVYVYTQISITSVNFFKYSITAQRWEYEHTAVAAAFDVNCYGRYCVYTHARIANAFQRFSLAAPTTSTLQTRSSSRTTWCSPIYTYILKIDHVSIIHGYYNNTTKMLRDDGGEWRLIGLPHHPFPAIRYTFSSRIRG